VDDHTFTLELDRAYNPDWFTANQLARIVPMPQRSWTGRDRDAPVGDADRTDEGAKQVFDYLVEQAKDLGSYSTNPLWQVVDGPFTLRSFDPSGRVVLARNPRYTGPDPAHLDTVTFLPFTSGTAEYNVLLAGGVDYGYLPAANLGQRDKLRGAATGSSRGRAGRSPTCRTTSATRHWARCSGSCPYARPSSTPWTSGPSPT